MSNQRTIIDSVKDRREDGDMAVPDQRVASVREFNRFFTAIIGVLDESLLHSPYSLTEARILFELAQRESTAVVELRRALSLDPGYLSRILARFDADGLVARARADDDGRRQVVRLTDTGRATYETLDGRSAAQVAELLGRLTDDRQQRVVDAMGTIQSILGDVPSSSKPTVRSLQPGDLGWVVQRHGALYAEEHGWDNTFEAMTASIVADYVERYDPRLDSAWIAEVNGTPVGSVFCVHAEADADDGADVAKLRLLLVEPSARGLGIGARLVDECISFAREAGYRSMVLWTVAGLNAARHIYEKAGFELIDEESHPGFGRKVTGQNWRLTL
jgi:DNA-binding MarR family transcriptional regulator/GNAT superfamily N-acetyltransferase